MSPLSHQGVLALGSCLLLAACSEGSDGDGKSPADDTEVIADTDLPGETDTRPTDTDPDDTDPVDPDDTDPTDPDPVDTDPDDTDPVDPDDTDTDASHTDTTPVDTDPPAPPTPYGPPNSWYHVDVADLPPGLTSTGVDVGDVAPNFTFIDQHGDQVELYQLYGQTIMLDIFAEWCLPCIEAAPHNEAFYAAHAAEGFMLLSIMQERSDTSSPRRPCSRRHHPTRHRLRPAHLAHGGTRSLFQRRRPHRRRRDPLHLPSAGQVRLRRWFAPPGHMGDRRRLLPGLPRRRPR